MLSQLPLLALLAGTAIAESTSTTSVFFGGIAQDDHSGDPDANPFFKKVVASIVSVRSNPSATVMAVNCASNDEDCAGMPAVTITANPTLFVLQSTIYNSDDNGMPISSEAITISTQCELQGSTSAICTFSEGGDTSALGYASEDPDFVSSPVTLPLSKQDITFTPVTITAGLEKLSQGASPASTGASSSGASATGGASVTGTASGSSAVASQTGNAAVNVGVGKGLAVGALAAAGMFLA